MGEICCSLGEFALEVDIFYCRNGSVQFLKSAGTRRELAALLVEEAVNKQSNIHLFGPIDLLNGYAAAIKEINENIIIKFN